MKKQTFLCVFYIKIVFLGFQASVVEDTHKDLLNAGELANYLRRDIQYCQLKNYDLTYALYSKFPS